MRSSFVLLLMLPSSLSFLLPPPTAFTTRLLALQETASDFDLKSYFSEVTPWVEKELGRSLEYQRVENTETITKVRVHPGIESEGPSDAVI